MRRWSASTTNTASRSSLYRAVDLRCCVASAMVTLLAHSDQARGHDAAARVLRMRHELAHLVRLTLLRQTQDTFARVVGQFGQNTSGGGGFHLIDDVAERLVAQCVCDSYYRCPIKFTQHSGGE